MVRMRMVAAWMAGLAVAAGCASEKPAPGPRLLAPKPLLETASVSRIDAPLGGVLVIPIDETRAERRVGEVKLADGRLLPTRRVRITAHVQPEQRTLGWVSPPGTWSSTLIAAGAPASGAGLPPGIESLVVELPAEAAGPLSVEGEARPTNWLPGGATLPRSVPGNDDPWSPARPKAAPEDVANSRWIAPEAKSPLTRWRWRLIHDGLRPGTDVEPFADPVIEALAEQNEDRWRVALAWLWAADADVAARLRQRLAGVVEFGEGVYAPCWPVNHEALDRLLADLLDPALGPGERVRVAAHWLETSPSAVAWVVDDGGTLDAGQRSVLPTVGLASLLDRSTLAWAAAAGTQSPDLRPLPAMSAVSMVIPAGAGVRETDLIEAHVGAWTTQLPAALGKVSVTPPGLTVPTLLHDWTMDAWVEGAPRTVRDEWVTGILLHRPAPEAGAPPTLERSRLWELYVECRVPPGTDVANEQVRVYAGPFGRPTSALLIRPTGAVELLPLAWQPPEAAELAGGVTEVTVVKRADRWSFRLPLPPGAVERGGLLRLGLTRLDSQGRRSAWPRAMLPWQEEPGRAALDTTTWGAITDAPE